MGTPANNAIQKFMDQNTVPQLFVATGAAVALKNHWGDKAFVRVIFDQPINHFRYDQSYESEARGIPTCVPQKSVDHNPCSSAARAPNRLS